MKVSLSRVIVKDLFGYVDFDIKNLEKNIVNFLVAMNGMGKTTILKMLWDLSTKNFTSFNLTDYTFLKFSFVKINEHGALTDSYINLHFKKDKRGQVIWAYINDLEIDEKPTFKPIPTGFASLITDQEKIIWLSKNSDKVSNVVKRAQCNIHWTVNGKGHMNDQEALEKVNSDIKNLKKNKTTLDEFSFLNGWAAYFIPINRVTSLNTTNYPLINELSTNLITLMKDHVVDTSDRSMEDEETVNQLFSEEVSILSLTEMNKISEEINNLETSLKKHGLITKTNPVNIPDSELSEGKKQFLSFFLKDKKNRLSSHEEFINRLAFFEHFINSSLVKKRISTNRVDGLVVQLTETSKWNEKVLKLDQLSSGEQHLLMLAYKIVFEIPEDTFVLIDEPEISIHMEWQEKLADIFDKIGDMRNLRFLCATHSPSIVSSRLNALRPIKPV